MENDFKKSYRTLEIAEMMQVTEETVREFIRNGRLGAYKAGKEWRVTDIDLYNFVEKNRNEVK